MRSAKSGHLVQHRVNFRHHVSPSTTMDAPFGARNATCSTARASVILILSPRNIASIAFAQAGLAGELHEQFESLVSDAVL